MACRSVRVPSILRSGEPCQIAPSQTATSPFSASMGTVFADMASSGEGGRRKRCDPGTTHVAPPSSVMPSHATQKVASRLCSGNGIGIQFESECTPGPPCPLRLMLPTMRPTGMALPQANSPNAMIFGSVATLSTAGCLPSSIGAPAMPPDLSRGFA